MTTLAEVVRAGLAGEPFRLELRWERWRPEPRRRWREEAPPGRGGGIMLDLHAHLVDIAVRLFGRVETVTASVASRSTVADDDAVLRCRHVSGVESSLAATSLAGAPGPFVRLLGRGGAYLVGALDGEPTAYADLADPDDDHCGWLVRGEDRQPVPVVRSSQADLYRAVRAALWATDPQAAMPVDPWDAVHTLEVIDAARVSAAEERVVPIR